MHATDSPELSPAQVLALYPPHHGTVGGLLESRIAARATHEALEFERRTWRYAELGDAAACMAGILERAGIERGQAVAFIADNSDLSALVFLGCAHSGAIFVPLNPAATDADLAYVLGHSRPGLVIAQPADIERVRQLTARLDPAPRVLALAELGLEEATAQGVAARLAERCGRGPAARAQPQDALVVIYTSGTTGFPKGVVHTHRTYLLAAEGFVARMHLQPEERLLTVLPFFHINALFYSLGGALACGGTLIIAPRFSASAFWSMAAQSRATQFNFLAAIGNILLNRPRAEFDPAHRIAKVYGGPISERMHSVFRGEFRIPTVLEGYGMTEIPGACCNPYAGPQKMGSIGVAAVHPSLPGPFSELRILDEEGRELPAGAVGELAVRTPMMFKEYLGDPAQTAAAFRDGWFLTGDLARRDEEGYFYFVARKKDIIRRRGENISGAELDRIVGEHPSVLEAAAIGVPAELGEEDILVAVLPRPGERVDPAAVLEWCRSRLAPMKVPRYLVVVDSLPHTPSHRVAKHRLKTDPTLLARAFDAERAPQAAARPHG